MELRRFAQVDVFTATPYRGNPVAVVLDAVGIADQDMAGFARWTNLSETTFVLPPTHPDADYRLRIFTPGAEPPARLSRSAASAWSGSGRTAAASPSLRRRCAGPDRSPRRSGPWWPGRCACPTTRP